MGIYISERDVNVKSLQQTCKLERNVFFEPSFRTAGWKQLVEMGCADWMRTPPPEICLLNFSLLCRGGCLELGIPTRLLVLPGPGLG